MANFINNNVIRGQLMELEKLFNQQFLYDLSFFNFETQLQLRILQTQI